MKIDFQNDVHVLGNFFFNGGARGAVAVAVHMRPFQKRLVGHHAVEFFISDKEILAAVKLLAARRARGVRHRRLHTCV